MKLQITTLLLAIICFSSCKKKEETTVTEESKVIVETKKKSAIEISPIEHATAVIEYGKGIIYIDPTGGAEAFKSFGQPNFIIITDIHSDHMDIKTLEALDLSNAKILAPKSVISELPKEIAYNSLMMSNGDVQKFDGFQIEAIPMYNLREEALKFHPKERGNGYVFTFGDERIYFSGDTEDIPEMRALKNIDKAFVCMNLPYTMTVESAASAVLEFKPKQVYPYHYRGTEGFSDVEKFKDLVEKGNSDIEVVQLDWYKEKEL